MVTLGRRLTVNVLWNLLGTIVPLAVGAIVIPAVLAEIGVERFGLLTLGWVVIGYFGIFDLGIPRAVTKLVAEQTRRDTSVAVGSSIWTAIWSLALVGIVTGAAFSFTLPLFAASLPISADLQREVSQASYLLGAAIPITVVSGVLRGVLEGRQRFGLVAAVRAPSGALTYLAPLVASWHSHDLWTLTSSLLIARGLFLGVTAICCWNVVPELRRSMPMDGAKLGELVSFGGWLTAGSVLNQTVTYADRLILATVVPAAMLSFYALPAEMVSKLLLVPGALSTALFPLFCSEFSQGKGPVTTYGRSLRTMAWTLAPLLLLLLFTSGTLLEMWVGAEFADRSGPVLKILLIGVFFNALAHIPVTLLHGSGRPRLAALITGIEVVPYLVILYWAAAIYGIAGAAVVWTARMVVDFVVLVLAASAVQERRWAAGARPATAT